MPFKSPDCEGSMRLEPGKPLWICSKRAMHPNKKIKKMPLYKNTIFEGQKSSPETIMEICWCFSLKLTYSQTAEQTKASPNSIHKWTLSLVSILSRSRATGEHWRGEWAEGESSRRTFPSILRNLFILSEKQMSSCPLCLKWPKNTTITDFISVPMFFLYLLLSIKWLIYFQTLTFLVRPYDSAGS